MACTWGPFMGCREGWSGVAPSSPLAEAPVWGPVCCPGLGMDSLPRLYVRAVRPVAPGWGAGEQGPPLLQEWAGAGWSLGLTKESWGAACANLLGARGCPPCPR